MNIEFINVTKQNRSPVLELKIHESQAHFMETIEQCLSESDQLAIWRPVAILIDNILVGFAMYGLFENALEKRVWLDRFLIDAKYQGKGYAKPILRTLIPQIVKEYQVDQVYLSIYENNGVAYHVYYELGFRFNGEIDENGENVMVLNIY